jgi:predicted nucleic acid-binding Zn ribbon protein
MIFKKCVACGLELPMSVLTQVHIRHQGRIVAVTVCSRCKEIKEAEAKRGQNAGN